MIHLFGKYSMMTDEHQFVVGIPRVGKDKDGREIAILTDKSYYSTLEGALKGTYKRLSREALQDVEGEFKDALRALYSLTDAFSQAIRDAVPMIDRMDDDLK